MLKNEREYFKLALAPIVRVTDYKIMSDVQDNSRSPLCTRSYHKTSTWEPGKRGLVECITPTVGCGLNNTAYHILKNQGSPDCGQRLSNCCKIRRVLEGHQTHFIAAKWPPRSNEITALPRVIVLNFPSWISQIAQDFASVGTTRRGSGWAQLKPDHRFIRGEFSCFTRLISRWL